MGAVHDEYLRYMQWLGATDESADVKRIARIVHDNLDALIPTVSNGGQRATALTPLLRRDLEKTPDVIEPARADAAAAELAARLTIASNALLKDGDGGPEHVQFSRITGGLARQLRSPLDEKIGRLSVDIPVFPE